MNERLIKILAHLAVQALIVSLVYNSIDTSQRWYEAGQLVIVVLTTLAFMLIYLLATIIAGFNNNKASKTFGKLLGITPIFWGLYWLVHIYTHAGIEANKSKKYIAEWKQNEANYKYTHGVLLEKLPNLLPGYTLLNPDDYIINPFRFATPYGDTIRVSKCIGWSNKSNYNKTTGIKMDLDKRYIKDTTFIKEKMFQYLMDFSNDSTLEMINGDWNSYISPLDSSTSSDRLETNFLLQSKEDSTFFGNLHCVSFKYENRMRYRILLLNSYCKLCIPMQVAPEVIDENDK